VRNGEETSWGNYLLVWCWYTLPFSREVFGVLDPGGGVTAEKGSTKERGRSGEQYICVLPRSLVDALHPRR